MYNSVVTDEDNHDFIVLKTRSQKILNCFNTQLLGCIRIKRRSYPTSQIKLLHALERDRSPQSSDAIDERSRCAITCLMILKESTPTKCDLIMQLKPEHYQT